MDLLLLARKCRIRLTLTLGTGKASTARKMGELFYDLGFLIY